MPLGRLLGEVFRACPTDFSVEENVYGRVVIRNLLLRQALAECLGTLILVMFGCGAVAQRVLSGGSHGLFLTVNFAFGFAAMLGILVCGQVSGGHLNPAVTFALCLLGRERWRKFPMYFLFQTIGAFFGSAIIFGMYYDALLLRPGSFNLTSTNNTAGIFATYPARHLTLVNGFFDQIIGTTALIVCVLAIVDPFNNPIPQGLEAFTVGFVVLVIGLSMGFNSGYAVNPARDFGPRLFTSMSGWGGAVFTLLQQITSNKVAHVILDTFKPDTGVRNRLRQQAHCTSLPSILLANVQSLENKLNDLRARVTFQRDMRDCNILCVTETWLTYRAVNPLDSFSVNENKSNKDQKVEECVSW
ncbi:ATP-binding protein involved in chromosome partitioning [Sarotherodon galilaeus]